ncbi:MAG TPA: hypothetical protein VKJ77_03165 [Caballeronia sp.]|jgi:hypothetical protein|nr:hypothetical protein [Caballeronia sp.]
MNDALSAQRAGLDPLAFSAVAAMRADMDAGDVALSLPGDHPAWQRDVFSISSRAKALIATIRPIVVKVLTFWDHHLRDITIGARTFGIDPSGCYRLR